MALIQCGDHKYAPAVVLCVHLCDVRSSEWCPIPSGEPEVEHDWLCPECLARMDDLSVDDLRTVCIHCVRELQAASQT